MGFLNNLAYLKQFILIYENKWNVHPQPFLDQGSGY